LNARFIIARLRHHGVRGSLIAGSDATKWLFTRLFLRRSPWVVNRFGQRLQTVSFADYRHLRKGNPEVRESLFVERVLRENMLVVDVGANHGIFALEAARHVGPQGVVHAFEPTPSTRTILETNLRINGANNVRVFGYALGAAPATASLRAHRDASGLNSLAAGEISWEGVTMTASEILQVSVKTLDWHAEQEKIEHIDFLKIDVEGFELSVLRGAKELLRSHRVGCILLEIADEACANADITALDVVGQLRDSGYELFDITAGGDAGDLIEERRAFPPGVNYIAIPAAALHDDRALPRRDATSR